MIINPNKNIIVFDLDDTLYKEVDFLYSAYRHISNMIESKYGINIYGEMKSWYDQGKSTFDLIKEKYKVHLTIRNKSSIFNRI